MGLDTTKDVGFHASKLELSLIAIWRGPIPKRFVDRFHSL